MSRYSSQIAALREHLNEADPPRWKSDLSALVSAPIPNLWGQMDLQRLLVGDALERYRRGNERDALRDLEAAWRHGEVLRQRPILVTRLNGWYAARLQFCGLRQICPGEEYYLRRVSQLRPRESLREGQALDVWLLFSPDHMYELTASRTNSWPELFVIRPAAGVHEWCGHAQGQVAASTSRSRPPVPWPNVPSPPLPTAVTRR